MNGGISGEASVSTRTVGTVPVRNIWLLFLYASNLANFSGHNSIEVETSPDFPSLVARLLCHVVETRLRRNLSRGYIPVERVRTRVTGRINILKTYSGKYLDRGFVVCRFDDFTLDTPRNRLVRAALEQLSGHLDDKILAHECRYLAGELGRLGVAGRKPTAQEIAADRMGRHDSQDQIMLTLAKVVFDLVLPTEDEGGTRFPQVERDAILVRKLFEKAVGNFIRSELTPLGWNVRQGTKPKWPLEGASAKVADLFPGMEVDIELEGLGRRIIIDTKFTSAFGRTRFRAERLRSAHIYQLYTYLRSQEDPLNNTSQSSSGILLYPTIDKEIDETVTVQGHNIRFATVNLALPGTGVINRLRNILTAYEARIG